MATLKAHAATIGYPLLVKATSGGGGKGMRLVQEAGQLEEAISSAQREAAASFGDERVLLERYIQRPRHIEVQVIADSHGNVLHLFDRDCSIQRRHQKVRRVTVLLTTTTKYKLIYKADVCRLQPTQCSTHTHPAVAASLGLTEQGTSCWSV